MRLLSRNRDRHDDREPFILHVLLVSLSPSDFRFLTHLRKSPRKEPRMLSSLHAHVACTGLDMRRLKAWDRLFLDGRW
jgi:hypothetical protein